MWKLLFLSVILSAQQPNVISEISDSGRCADLAESPDARVAPGLKVPPGPPPLLSFRYYEGKLHHRYGNSELMLDDAGH
jgi:hypothetical protein